MTLRNSKHPFTGQLYQLTEDRNIEIIDGDKRALFTREGRFISGDFRECDPQLCVWVANNPEADKPADSDSHLALAAKNRRSAASPIISGPSS